MAATLTSKMLDDLHRGNAAISLVAYPDAGVDFSTLDFSAADRIYTLKDSFQISQDDPTTEDINIDQNDAPIDTDVTNGSISLTGSIPSVATALLSYFYKDGVDDIKNIAGQDSKSSYSGNSFFVSPKDVIVTVLCESKSQKTAICFAKVKMTVALTQDDSTNPVCLKFTGTVLTNAKEGEGDFAVLKSA